MINLNDKLSLEGYGLLLQNNELTITKTLQNEYIVVDDDLTINVLEDVSVNILDTSSNKNIIVIIDDNANVNYQIINSNSSNRRFVNNGNLNVCEICLNQTNSNLLIELVTEQANSDVSVLSITNEGNQNFIQNVIHKAPKTFSNISSAFN